jgi:hypothetical protein
MGGYSRRSLCFSPARLAYSAPGSGWILAHRIHLGYLGCAIHSLGGAGLVQALGQHQEYRPGLFALSAMSCGR